jgi:cellobiose PTS system EIIB component
MKIILVCSAGMSTSMLVQRMRIVAGEKGVIATIHATSEADLVNHLDQTDVILVGPQVRYLAPKIKEKAAPLGIQVEVIDSMAYGMMDGGKVFEQAEGLVKSK